MADSPRNPRIVSGPQGPGGVAGGDRPVMGFARGRPGPALLSPVRGWARRTFAPDRVVGGLKSLLWVGPLTLLIWVYAEREQMATRPNVSVPIEVTSSDARRVVTLVRPESPSVLVTLSGPQGQVERVREKLDPRAGNPPVQIEVDRNLGPGVQRIPASRVGDFPVFAGYGVTVSGAQPEWLEVFIDPVVERDVAVQVPAGVGLLHAPAFDPPSVKVRGPESVLDAAAAAGQLVAYAALAGRPELTRSEPKVTVPDVKVTLPFQHKHVSPAGPATVTATVDLAQAEYRLDSVRVFVVSPPGLLNDSRVDYPITVTNVTVVGPREQIEKLKQPDFLARLKATFEVSQSHVGAGEQTAPLKYELPPGVTVKDEANNQIRFTLTRRDF